MSSARDLATVGMSCLICNKSAAPPAAGHSRRLPAEIVSPWPPEVTSWNFVEGKCMAVMYRFDHGLHALSSHSIMHKSVCTVLVILYLSVN